MAFGASPIFVALVGLIPNAAFADCGPGTVSDADRAAWPGATFVTYTVSGKPWTIRFDSGTPPTQAQIDTALGQ